VGKPKAMWLEPVEEDTKNLGVSNRAENSGGNYERSKCPRRNVLPVKGEDSKEVKEAYTKT
jgi:hypothetical protein